MRRRPAVLPVAVLALAFGAPADARERPLQMFWVDVEGGAATLIVTPAGQSVLVDTGNPGGRDAARIAKVAREAAGLARLDHVVITHFHRDHFGGLAELARLLPVGTVHERDLASAPEAERAQPELKAYREAPVGGRRTLAPDDRISLEQRPGTALVSLDVLGASGVFARRAARPNAAVCAGATAKDPDTSDNRNSVVLRLQMGAFSFFDGGDLTWENEGRLVCPEDLSGGAVDVAQIDHHGLDVSNNPLLFRTLRPTVVVVNNGPRKGHEPATAALLRKLPGLRAVYQLHRNLKTPETNLDAAHIANADEDCAAHFVRLQVEPDGTAYEVWVPSTGHRTRYQAR